MTGTGELAMFLAIGAAAVAVLFGPIAAAVGRRIGGRPEPDDAHAEVEERLDFAERFLAHGRQVDQLPGGARR